MTIWAFLTIGKALRGIRNNDIHKNARQEAVERFRYLCFGVAVVVYAFGFFFAAGEGAEWAGLGTWGHADALFELVADGFFDGRCVGMLVDFEFDEHMVTSVDVVDFDEVFTAYAIDGFEDFFNLCREHIDAFDFNHVVGAA